MGFPSLLSISRAEHLLASETNVFFAGFAAKTSYCKMPKLCRTNTYFPLANELYQCRTRLKKDDYTDVYGIHNPGFCILPQLWMGTVQ